MYQSNDYLKLTKEYLKNLSYHEQALKNIKADTKALEYELSNITLPGVQYSDEPRGGSPELSSVEKQAYVRDLKRQELTRLNVSAVRLEQHIHKVHDSVAMLPEEERVVIDLMYGEKLTAVVIGEQIGLCERSVHRRLRSAIGNLAVMLFGPVAAEDISFVRS